MAKRNPITSLGDLHDDDIITLYDVAAVLKMHYSTAYEIVVSGQMGEFIRRGRNIRVEVRVLRAYIDSCRRNRPTRSPNSFITVKKAPG